MWRDPSDARRLAAARARGLFWRIGVGLWVLTVASWVTGAVAMIVLNLIEPVPL